MTTIYIDADACPVKAETYRVAQRHALPVVVVSNTRLRTPLDASIRLVVVGDGLDVADDWIAERAAEHDVVITADIPLAARCVERGALVLAPTGRQFTEDGIGDALATRDLMAELRESGLATGGPPPFGKRDRSRFLQQLDEVIRSAQRARMRRPSRG